MATIPARMHFPYALRVAKRGFSIRRVDWSDVWWVWRSGVMMHVETGQPDHVVQSEDYDSDDLLAWDWTTLPVGCDQLSDPVDMAELLTVRPYDGLPVAADPLGRKCALPTRAEALEPDWPLLGLPKVKERKVLFSRPTFEAPALPSGEGWLVSRPRKLVEGVTPPPPLALSFLHNDTIASYISEGFCIDPATVSGSPSGGSVQIRLARLTLSGGTSGTTYVVSFGIASSPTVIGTEVWSGNMTTGQTINFSPQPYQTITFPWNSTKTLLAQARLSGSVVASASLVITMPAMCSGS